MTLFLSLTLSRDFVSPRCHAGISRTNAKALRMTQEKIEETLGKHGDALKIYRDDISKLKQQNRELKDDIQSLLQLIQHVSVCLSHIPLHGPEEQHACENLRGSLEVMINKYKDDSVE
jgi:uncharacterized protein YdcH (DUF465 family)